MPAMNTDRITIDARTGAIRGPWEEPVRAGLPVPQTDPRLEISEQALGLASQNAFPIVARQKTRRDKLGLAAGGAIALVLGCATFVSLNSGRHSSTVPATSAQAQQQAGLPMATTAIPGRPIAAPPGAMSIPGQPAPITGAAPGPMTAMSPGMPAPGSSPVLVYDGSSPQGAQIAAGPNTPRDADGAPAMFAG